MFTKQTDPPADLSNIRTDPPSSQKDTSTTAAAETSGEQIIQTKVTPPQAEVKTEEKKVIQSRFSTVKSKMSTYST